MNESLNLPKLIAQIAAETGSDPVAVRRFLHELFSLIEQSLTTGEIVAIKGVGEFAKTDDPANPVKFLADSELAEAVNQPFAAFEAVELADSVTEADLAAVEAKEEEPTTATQPEPEPVQEPVQEPMQEPVSEPVIEIETEPEPEPELIEPEPEPEIEPEPEEEPQAESEEEPEEEPEESTIVVQQKSNAHPTLMLILGILIGIVIGVAAGYYAGRLTSQIEQANAELGMNDSDEEALPMDSDFVEDAQVVEAAQHAAVATEAPAEAPKAEEKTEAKATTKNAEPVYDTVTSSRYLSTIARDHYGKKSYWIFIYEANPSLGNPNSISPGTRVLVPSRESFDAGSPEATDAKAQQHLNTLSHKYKL